MGKTALFLFTAIILAPLLCAQPGAEYCPIDIGRNWTYSFFSKKENKQKPDVYVYIKKKGKYRGEEFTIYEVPSRGMRYFVKAAQDGVYMRAGQADIPVLSFINISMDFKPAPVILRYPIKNNESWRCEAVVGVRALGIINLEQKAWADFRVTGPAIIEANSRTYNAYRIEITISRSFNEDKPMKAECYMAEGVGLVKTSTLYSALELKPEKE